MKTKTIAEQAILRSWCLASTVANKFDQASWFKISIGTNQKALKAIATVSLSIRSINQIDFLPAVA